MSDISEIRGIDEPCCSRTAGQAEKRNPFLPTALTRVGENYLRLRARLRRDIWRQRNWRTHVLAFLFGLATAIAASAAIAQPSLTCGTAYTVERGDTLFKIAERAYGDGWLYKTIFQANRDLLPDEGSLEIGYELLIPCLEGSRPATRLEAIAAGQIDMPEMEKQRSVSSVEEPEQPGEDPEHAVGVAPFARTAYRLPRNSCASFHTVKQGETLFKIAERAYGDGWLYKTIFQANRDLLPDEGSLEISDDLLIPCLDGRGPATRREALAWAQRDESEQSDQEELARLQASALPVESTGPTDQRFWRLAEEVLRAAHWKLLPHSEFGDSIVVAPDAFDGEVAPAEDSAAKQVEQTLPEIAEDPTTPGQAPSRTSRLVQSGPAHAVSNVDSGQSVIDKTSGPSSTVETGPSQRKNEPNAPLQQTSEMKAEAQPHDVATDRIQIHEHPDELFARSRPLPAFNKDRQTAVASGAANPVEGRQESLGGRSVDPASANSGSSAEVTKMIGAVANEDAVRTFGVRIQLVTVPHLVPYAGRELPGGGMITELVARAVKAAGAAEEPTVSFVDDWLLPLTRHPASFDVSFPWYKPDCGNLQGLDEQTRALCADFHFTRPFVEDAISFYVRSGAPLADVSNHAALEGQRICRPTASAAFGIDRIEIGLAQASIESPKMTFVCWAKLVQGEVDVVMARKRQADQDLRALGIADQVAEAEELVITRMLHGIVPKSNPRSQPLLRLINEGLDRIMLSGEWFDIVAAHNSRHAALTN